MSRLHELRIHWKFTLYENSWWLLPVSFIGAVIALFLLSSRLEPSQFLAMVGIFLSLFYFIQKQRLEEMKLFREIFAECNSRYDELNEELDRIFLDNSDGALADADKAVVIDYFNLCAEEYLGACILSRSTIVASDFFGGCCAPMFALRAAS